MSPRIMSHHHTITESEREFINNKVSSLKKFYGRITEVSVILDSAKTECQAELLVFGPQLSLRVKYSAQDMRSAFEGALNKAERTISKMKDKKWGGKKHGRRNVTIRRFRPEDIIGEEPVTVPESVQDEIHIEHMEPLPMTLDEARRKMLKGKNGILVFVNPKTDEINLLHRNAKEQIELVELTGTVLFQPATMEIAEAQ